MSYSIQGAISAIKSNLSDYFTGNGEDTDVFDIKFDIVGEETMSMSSDITDNYVETNVAYQDQISLKPRVYTVNGEIGELVYYKKDEDNSVIGAVSEKLTQVASFLPSTSKSFSSVRDKAIKISNFVNSIDNFANRLGKMTETGNKQQLAFDKLFQTWKQRRPVNVKTAWRTLNGFVISDIKITQKDTVDKSSISITFKELRTTQMGTTPFKKQAWQGRAKEQKEEGLFQSVRAATTSKVTNFLTGGRIQ